MKNSQRSVYLILGILLSAMPVVSHAEVFAHLTGEGGKVEYDITKNPGNGWYTETDSSARFKLGFKQGARSSATPNLVATVRSTSTEHFKGESAIELKIIANNEVKSLKAAYKVDLSIVKPDDRFSPSAITPKDWYHSFALKIDATDYRLPDEPGQELIFEQWWQGSPFAPPVSLVIFNEGDARARGWSDANPDGNFAIVLRDDEHGALSTVKGEPRIYNLGPVKTGEWMQWVVHVRPDPTGKDGAVTVLWDGVEKLKLENILVGYNPANYAVKPRPAKMFAYVGCCLYRLNGQSSQCFFFDEIKFSDRLEDALSP